MSDDDVCMTCIQICCLLSCGMCAVGVTNRNSFYQNLHFPSFFQISSKERDRQEQIKREQRLVNEVRQLRNGENLFKLIDFIE